MDIIYDFTKVNFTKGRNGHTIKGIVIHDTDNKSDTARGNANYFRDIKRGGSAHYFVDEKEVVQVVKEGDTSWGIGVSNYGKLGNRDVINIEMCNVNYQNTDKTFNLTLELVKDLIKKYGLNENQVYRHYDLADSPCPISMSKNNYARWWEFKKCLKDNNITSSNNSNEFKNGDLKGKFKVVANGGLNVRSGRGTQYSIIGNLPTGEIIETWYCLNDWVSFGYKNQTGYVSVKYLKRI